MLAVGVAGWTSSRGMVGPVRTFKPDPEPEAVTVIVLEEE